MKTTKTLIIPHLSSLIPSPVKGERGGLLIFTLIVSLLATLSSPAAAQDVQPAEADSLTGTWTLTDAALTFENQTAGQAQAGNLSVAKIRNFVTTALQSAGLDEGTLALTFNPDGTCAVAANGMEVGTTCSIRDERLIINFPSASLSGSKTAQGTTPPNEKGLSVGTLYKQEGNCLSLAIRAEKLAALLQAVGFEHEAVYNIITVGKFMKNYPGLLIGLNFER